MYSRKPLLKAYTVHYWVINKGKKIHTDEMAQISYGPVGITAAIRGGLGLKGLCAIP
jgi:hypothetical protein